MTALPLVIGAFFLGYAQATIIERRKFNRMKRDQRGLDNVVLK